MRAITGSFARSSYPSVAAGSTVQYRAILVDQDANPTPGSELESLTLSVVDTSTGDIINSVDDVDILNTGRGSVDESGNLLLTLEPNDTVLDSGIKRAIRSLVLTWTFNGGRVGRHQVDFRIEALVG